jgi:arsenate reductase
VSQAPAVEPRRSASINRPPLKVLFLCTHNSARSQIAEGFARALAPASVQVWSAGTEPRGVHPRAIEVMGEVGIDLAGHASKTLDQVPWRECDTVVTLCGDAAEACPALAAEVRRLHWPLPDPGAAPEAEQAAAFREVRDEIRWRVACLWPRGG